MSATSTSSVTATSRTARFSRGLRLGLPIFLGYVPVGTAFGILAHGLGFTPFQAMACSATALAGAGQFIALALMRSGAAALTVVAATTVVNLRYVLFGAALSPYARGIPLGGQALLGFSLTDETFAVNIDDNRQGRADLLSMTGVGAVAWVGWVLGTALGALAGGLIEDPMRWGVQFAMPAMFSALLVAQIESRRHAAIAVVAGLLTLGFMLVLPDRWYVVATPIVAATIGAVTSR